MKLRFNRDDALAALQPIQGILGAKSMLPVLANVLIEVQEGSCRAVGSDLELWISSRFPAQVEAVGTVSLPGKRLFGIIREAPDEEILLEGEEGSSRLTSGRANFKMLAVPPSEFPASPRLGDTEQLDVPQAEFRRLLRQTSYAISQDQSRYILNGLYLSFREGVLTAAATDGKRLATAETELKMPSGFDREIVITVKTVNELQRVLGEEGDVSVRVGEKQVSFETEDILLVSRLIDGRYPDFRQVIPSETREKITLPREEFSRVIRRGALLTSDKSNSVRFSFAPGQLTVTSVTPEVGESREEMTLEYQGEGMEIAFNPGYLLEVLRALENREEVTLELIDENSPGVFRDDRFFCLVMPMKLS